VSAGRMHFRNTVHFVTNRCEHEMLLLLPTARTLEIIQGWFARALSLYGDGLEIYAFIFLSNHLHLLVNDTKGTLAAFMWYFQSNVAKAINKELGRNGRFWSRAYDDVIVNGDDELLDRYAYTLANAVKAGLVDRSEEWPGWSSLEGALTDGKYSVEMLNQTKLHNATRRGQKVDKSEFIETWTFELTPPPFLKNLEVAERNRFIRDLLNGAEKEFRAARDNKPPLGVPNIMNQNPLDRPKNSAFRPRIKVYCIDRERRLEWLSSYQTFIAGYREVFDSFRKASAEGRRPVVEWPMGSYPPSCWYPVGSDRAS